MNNNILTLDLPNRLSNYLAEIESEIKPLQEQLLNHKVYSLLTDISALRIFLEHHIFAVKDFMFLVKTLQNKLTCTDVIWTPPKIRKAARLINEIVLGEETDENPNGSYISHFELYLEAMEELGAQTEIIKNFSRLLQEEDNYLSAMALSNTPIAAGFFVLRTLNICFEGSLSEIASYFVFGRENLIPELFPQLVYSISQNEDIQIDKFRYYLERHIEIDSQEHKGMSRQILIEICGDDPMNWLRAKNAAISSLKARLDLWDSIAEAIQNSQTKFLFN